jgi:hypothetical protein
MSNNNGSFNVIGVGGISRSGKNTFCNLAEELLKENGYVVEQYAFANALKDDIDSFLKEKYGISAWTEKSMEKSLIRPLLVAHGCSKREQTGGKYWIDIINKKLIDKYTLQTSDNNYVALISDVRFTNETNYIKRDWNGWFIHIRKYEQIPIINTLDKDIINEILNGSKYSEEDKNKILNTTKIVFDGAPNEEEKHNDPLIQRIADYHLDWPVVDDINELKFYVKECLSKCPFLNIK